MTMIRRFVISLAGLALVVGASGCNDGDPTAPGAESPVSSPPYLLAEPPYSPGTDNTLSWTLAMAGNTDGWTFLVQRGTDPGFTDVPAESGWISATSFTFADLAHGTTHHYRVMARDPDGRESGWSLRRTSTQDDVAPTATLSNLSEEPTSLLIDFHLAATDETSGIQGIELWYRANDADAVLYDTFPPGPARFQATESGPHVLFPVAVDGSGNKQDLALAPGSATLVPEPVIITDLKGEDFDITYSVLELGMSPNYWEYGVGRFTIRPIIDPLMIGPGEVGYPPDANTTEIVGVQFGDDVRAYKIGDIRNREAVNDVVDGIPMALTYCPLCDAHGVYDRVLDGEVLTIAASGWTWHQIFVLQDYETGSLWFPGLSYPGNPDFLLCIAGPHQGKKIFALPSHRTRWRPWHEVYPESLIMKTK